MHEPTARAASATRPLPAEAATALNTVAGRYCNDGIRGSNDVQSSNNNRANRERLRSPSSTSVR
eukprot:scaffold68862_cov65-Phaeocystis_antarctica.AAC.3